MPKGKWNNEAAQKEHGSIRGLANRTHELTKTPEHRAWRTMRQRCNNPNDCHYPYYGARGILVCSRWNDFLSFLSDMGPRPTEYHSIDRIDVNGNYEPQNCRWATQEIQQNNKRRTRRLEFGGIQLSIAQWSRKLGIATSTIWNRLKAGYPIEKVLSPKSFRKKAR